MLIGFWHDLSTGDPQDQILDFDQVSILSFLGICEALSGVDIRTYQKHTRKEYLIILPNVVES